MIDTSHQSVPVRQPRVCVVGSANVDLVVRTRRHPAPGETVTGSSFATFLGGKGFNQAVAARRAGANVTFIARVGGDDFGRRLVAHLQSEGVDASHVGIDEIETTGVALPVVDDSTGVNSIIVVPGANHQLRPSHVEAAAAVIRAADVMLVQLEVPTDTVVAAARLAAAAGALVVLNPAPAAPLPQELCGLVDVIVPNESEARSLTSAVGDEEELAAALRRMFAVQAVVLTLAERGGLLADATGVTMWAAHEVQCIDSVAAGDAFCGALAAALASGRSMADAVVAANAAGALAVTRAGAEPSLPTAAEVEAFLAR